MIFLMFDRCETSIKWEIKTKPLVIGKEARLSCNGVSCSPNSTKRWIGGQDYEVLCFYDELLNLSKSINLSKYEMSSNGKIFDLRIKDLSFSDMNCEYTCSCGFLQYTRLLKIDDEEIIYPPTVLTNSITQYGGIFNINVSIDVYPIPKCKLLLKKEDLASNISVWTRPDEGGFEPFKVSFHHVYGLEEYICQGNITLDCQIGSHAYSILLHRFDLCKDTDTSKDVEYLLISLLSILVTVIAALSFVYCVKLMNKNGINRRNDHLSLRSLCMACRRLETDPTGATDEGTPCNK